MNKLTITISIALAGITGSGRAFAGDKGPTPNKDILDVMWNSKDAKPFIDEKYPIFELDPEARCVGPIDTALTYSIPLYQQRAAGMSFDFGLSGGVRLISDSTRMGVEARLGPTVDIDGNGGRLIDLHLTATTNSDGKSSLDLGLFSFGFELTSTTIADTTDPIAYIDSMGYSLPTPLNRSFGDGIDCSLPGTYTCAFGWNASFAAVADIGAIFLLRVSSAGVEARTLVAANSYSALHAGGSLDVGYNGHALHGEISGTGYLDVGRIMFGARGLFIPWNGRWLADSAASLSVDDAMGAALTGSASVSYNNPQTGSHFSLSVSEPLLELLPTEYVKDWQYQCSFDKPF